MCYSAEVQADLEKLMERFQAEISGADDVYFQELRKKGKNFQFLKEALHLPKAPRSNFFKVPASDNRIFPGYFTWVMVHENGRRVFKRMRYRVRPAGSTEEIPVKYNVFNARIDSLESRQTWQKLFTRQHGLFPFVRFFEWVEEDGKKRLVSFLPEKKEIMWAPCLWDYWENPEKTLVFYSFALITDDPPPEGPNVDTIVARFSLRRGTSMSGPLPIKGAGKSGISSLKTKKTSFTVLNGPPES